MDYALASSSLAHTYGNVTSFITEFIKDLFPKNYFKTIHISSTIGYRQFNIFQNTNKEFLKKNKPMLIIRPRVDLNNSDTFLFGTLFTQRMTDNFGDYDVNNLQDFISDKDSGRTIKYLLNRMQLFFDISIIVESQMEQINQAMFIKNKIRTEHPFFIDTALESNIPRELMNLISKDSGIPIYDSNNNVKNFLDYINSNSIYPVTYKMKNSTGNDEFFRFYPARLDTMITGLSIDDGAKKNFVSDMYTISFTVNTEFYMSGLYFYFTKNSEIIQEVDMSILNDDKSIIPIFTVSNIYTEKPPVGWSLYTSPLYKVEADRKPDIMDISPILNHNINTLIAYHISNGITLDTFLKAVVMKDNVILDPSVGDYNIDFENKVLTTYNTNMVSTYRLIIYINTLYVNELLGDILKLNEER